MKGHPQTYSFSDSKCFVPRTILAPYPHTYFCVYIYIYTYTHTHIYVYICTYICVYTCIHMLCSVHSVMQLGTQSSVTPIYVLWCIEGFITVIPWGHDRMAVLAGAPIFDLTPSSLIKRNMNEEGKQHWAAFSQQLQIMPNKFIK